MKQTTIPVIFRKDKRDNEVVAFFPTMKSDLGFVTIYAHNGQHCEGRVEYFLEETTPVSKEEYTPLLNELRTIGYDNMKVYDGWKRKWL